MNIDREEARRIARLAHLELDDAGLDRMAVEMTTILDYVDQLRAVDVSTIASETSPATPLRADEPHEPLDRELIAGNAPAWRDGLFVVPKVLGGE